MPKSAIFWCQMYSLAMLLRLLMILVPKTPKFRLNHKWLILEHPNYQIFTVLPIFVQIIANISDISTHFSICTDFNLKCI